MWINARTSTAWALCSTKSSPAACPPACPSPPRKSPRTCPPALDKIVAKCVEPDPRDRYQSAAELRQAFQPVIQFAESGISTSKTNLTRRVRIGAYSPKKIIGAVIVAAILLATLWGLGQAEQHRRALATTAPEETVTPDGGMSTSSAAPSFADYEAIMEDLGRAAKARGGDRLNGALEHGNFHWMNALAEAETNPARALESAGLAVQCYLAPLLPHDGMVFVPPGITLAGGANVNVAGFFMDEYEVSVAAYELFTQQEKQWTVPPELTGGGDYPIGNVTCIDAMAYAAWRGAKLPTEAQWARAASGDDISLDFPWEGLPESGDCNALFADTVEPAVTPVGSFPKDVSVFGCYDMIGNVSEWTRTAEPPLKEGETPTFRTKMVTKGGNASLAPQPWHSRYPFPFEDQNIYLGFRCVQEIPTSPQAARAVLRGSP